MAPAISTSVPDNQATLPTLPARLNQARKYLLSKGLYLGDTSTSNNDAADTDDTGLLSADTLDIPEEAILSMVGTVSNNDYYLTADTGFRGNSEFQTTFAKVKASGTVEVPIEHLFAVDFPIVLKNIASICGAMVTPGFKNKKGICVGLGGSRVKIRHALFEPKAATDGDEADAAEDDQAGLDDIDAQKKNTAKILTLENWPVKSKAAAEQLEEMKGCYHAVLIPAYDMHGELIHSSFYRHRLEGALVAVRFTLTHWAIKNGNSDGTDIYTADIVNIRVLAPPKPTLVTPRKHGRVPAFDSMSPLPLEKKRCLFE
ncbi:uncharacterized protein PHACADRAFT_98432 [Phanerochaete carnosa HHB-10118-sp]|uniref:Uncharacterized protein n=1 Tax=Phanerochaete carnosa (strain HHB-10118-sp) TaxID=650164 RepID=K5VQK5_PHACS|nr:uncharacterized protein PHACADRAFT_98432 [Phanerochaete carnosa HHB-10118-sp]EKM53753.1 hypothetical protein PHACADRAFT_98432 [Phanerochaete carnosa HHB-10118-sp]